MKPKHGVIIIAVLLGLFAWVLDTGFDYFIFYKGQGFWNLLLLDVPQHEIYIRSIILGCFLAFGLAQSRSFAKRERAEQALRESEENLRVTFMSIGDGVISTDAGGRVTRMNPVAEELTGWKAAEAEGRPLAEAFNIINEDSRQEVESPVDRVLREGVVVGLANHTVLVARDGTERAIADSGAPIRNASGEMTGVVLVFRDVSEERAAERRIFHLNAVLRAIRDVNQLITRVRDRDELLQKACECLVETRGYHTAWLAALDESRKPVAAGLAGWGEHDSKFREALLTGRLSVCGRRALETPDVLVVVRESEACESCPLRGTHAGKSTLSVRLEHAGRTYGVMSATVPADLAESDEERELFLEMAGDLGLALHSLEQEAERRKAEEGLRESEARYRSLFEHMLNGFAYHKIITDEEGRPVDYVFLEVNAAFEALTGLNRHDIIGKRVTEVLPGIEKSEFDWIGAYGQVALEGKPLRIPDQHSAELDKWYNVSAYSAERGYFAAVFEEVTARKRAEQELRASEERYREFFENNPQYCYMVSPEGIITDVNGPALKALGYGKEELVGKPVNTMYDPSSAAKAKRLFAQWKQTGRIRNEEMDIRTKTGDRRTVLLNVDVVMDASGEVSHSISVQSDITERKRAEQERNRLQDQLQQSAKMEAIGQLAGGVAHDFNNLLAAILGYADMLRLKVDKDSFTYTAAENIKKAAERAADLTKQLLGFARKGKVRETAVDLHAVLRDVTALLSRTIDKNIDIVEEFQADPAVAVGDPTQLEQVFLNLAINARDAMPGGGTLSLATEIVEVDAQRALALDVAPGRYLLISVADTGSGMSEEVKERIFEPFFTTKDPGKGTGMGLATVYGVVRNHEGAIQVESEPGSGSTFKVYLPTGREAVGERDARRAAEASPEAAAFRGSGRILVVDDEAMVRDMASEMLKGLGYEVLTAADGEEAVRLYRERGADIDLVVIDMIMPVMGGRECFRQLKELDPAVKAILSTGYSVDGTAQEMLDEGMLGCAQKPYQVSQLAEAVARALGKQEENQDT